MNILLTTILISLSFACKSPKVDDVVEGGVDTVVFSDSVSFTTDKYVILHGDYVFTVNGLDYKMIYVPGGEYDMASTMISKGMDRHQMVENFHIGEMEVTQGLWASVMSGARPSCFKRHDDHPVEKVSWYDCKSFVETLNAMNIAPSNYEFALPTSAQWEYAARGGKENIGVYGVAPDYKYSGSNDVLKVGWIGENFTPEWRINSEDGRIHTHAVGLKSPNGLGIYDMTGNVWEWCEDTILSSSRVFRGNSWGYCCMWDPVTLEPHYSICVYDIANCNYDIPECRYYTIGLRLALIRKE